MSDRPTHPRGNYPSRGPGRGGPGRGHHHHHHHHQHNQQQQQQQQQQYGRGGGGSTRGGRGGRGGAGAGTGGGGGGAGAGEKQRKENILDLQKYMDKRVAVKFNGGREVNGVLKGFDALMNLVLDEVQEVMRDDEGNKSSRSLGLVVVRGTLLVLISPVDGSEVIENPFMQQEQQLQDDTPELAG